MYQNYIKQYDDISSKIEAESNNYVGHLFSLLVDEAAEQEEAAWFIHEIAMLTLRRESFGCMAGCGERQKVCNT